MEVLLLQLDGGIPNIALMRLAAHHRALGDSVVLRWSGSVASVQPDLFDGAPDRVYASLIFDKTKPVADELLKVYPEAIIGGTGWDMAITLEQHGVGIAQDYSDYPKWQQSIGFTQRGCRLRCPFCVVPRKEGAMREEQGIYDLWRGEPWPRELILLDNDFFGQPNWAKRIGEIRSGKFKVSFIQGINARFLTDDAAAAIASIDYRDDSMTRKRVYTAWDNKKDHEKLFAGLNRLVAYGVKPDHIMVYMLIGYWPGETDDDWEYRRSALREFGARPYPMPYARTRHTVGYQRFVVGAYDKHILWVDFVSAKYDPRKLIRKENAI